MDALAAVTALYYFFIGIADGTVSSRTIGFWLLVMGIFTAILLGSIWLKNQQYLGLSMATLLIIAIPALLYLLFILIASFGNQRWN